MFEIQQANWRDLKDLQQLEKICFEGDAWPLLDLMAALTFPGMVRLKAVSGEKMVGFISGDLRHRQRVGWITTIGVLPEYRRLGIASALLMACEQAMGMPSIKLCVRRSNFAAQNLYLRHGYHKVDVWKKYYSDAEDALVYRKQMEVEQGAGSEGI